MTRRIRVEIVRAGADRLEVRRLELAEESTVRDALEASGIAARCPRVDLAHAGIFGRVVSLDTRLADGDRVEIYRPLRADPRQARRHRASRPGRR
ncbi:MAG: RnfH family protein [Burkholderiales bacterium]|nr:RnfH family protein [Burkholderiales bacterium]